MGILKDLFDPLLISYSRGKKTAMEQNGFTSPETNIGNERVWSNRTLDRYPLRIE